jgi:outer membrane protein OmpA-like peptidoglycan-associated protein
MSIGPIKVAAIATTALALVFSSQASAAGWWHDSYWGFGAGWQFQPPDSLAFTTSDADEGPIAKIEFGGNMTKHWRSEIELSRWWNEMHIDPPGAPFTKIDGDYAVTVLSLNFLYDFNPGGRWSAHLGAGGGPGYFSAQGSGPGPWVIDDHGWALGGHVDAGLSYRMEGGTMLDIDYRYSGLSDAKVSTTLGKVKESFENGAAMLSLRFPMQKAAPPPPPPPPPPPQATTSDLGPYKVYFAWDKSNLTKEAMATVQEVASMMKNKKIKRVHVEGNADTSGGDDYNQRLSDQRATSVRDALISLGVPAGSIDMVGRGETNPAVKSGDGIKEPLNRRAEITITIYNQ